MKTLTVVRSGIGLLQHPRRAYRLLTRRALALQVILHDPETYHALSAWTYGHLPRVPVEMVRPNITDADVRLSRFIGRYRESAPTTSELAILCALVRSIDAQSVLEIGTSDGGTTFNLAMNLSDGGTVTTMDLPSEVARSDDRPKNASGPELVGKRFHGTPAATRIRQIYADSTKTDWITLGGPFDLIFIDGCHEYEYVRLDTVSALHCVRPGGLIVWHDYGITESVSRAVDEASEIRSIAAVLGTSLAVCVNGAT